MENLSYAVLDRDQTLLSQNYALNLSGSRYFIERPPITDYAELDRRMRAGGLALAIEIPSGFTRGHTVQIGIMPVRAETVQGYNRGCMLDMAARRLGQDAAAGSATIAKRFRYNLMLAMLNFGLITLPVARSQRYS